MLYFNGQKSKVALVKYNRNDYEKVLEGLEEVSITIPSSFTNIDANALKGLNNIELNYSGSASGKPWGATNVITSEATITFSMTGLNDYIWGGTARS
jgi:hypothetical protein